MVPVSLSVATETFLPYHHAEMPVKDSDQCLDNRSGTVFHRHIDG